MTFRVGYLTPREASIWDLRRQKLKQSDIGRKLGVSRQAVHKAYQIIDQKIEKAFVEVSETNNLTINMINLVEGIMLAHSPAHNLPVVVSLSNSNGLKVWYLYKGNCESCHLESSCREILEAEAKERGIKLTSENQLIPPTKLAQEIFGRYQND